jgi:hypothetical protein
MCKILSASLQVINSLPLTKRDLLSCFILFTSTLKSINISSQISFLSACNTANLLPKGFSLSQSVPSHLSSNPIITRKTSSLEKSILNAHISHLRSVVLTLHQTIGFESLNLARAHIPPYCLSFIFSIFNSHALNQYVSFSKKHAKKFANLLAVSNCKFSIPPPGFQFPTDLSKRLTIDSNISIDSATANLLSKGPKFALPPLVSKKLHLNIAANLEKVSQDLRWKVHHAYKTSTSQPHLSHPFDKQPYFAPKPSVDKDLPIQALKFNLKTILNSHFSKNPTSKYTKEEYNLVKKLSKAPDLIVVKSDKTNRLVITKHNEHFSKTEALLHNTDHYIPLPKHNIPKLESKSNQIMSSITHKCASLMNIRRVLVSRFSSHAHFFSLIKDHKTPTESGFPLRPIASVHNTAVEKLDWLANKILSQLVPFIPAHLPNSDSILTSLQPFMLSMSSNSHFISLDVVNLYPSIPISDGISACTQLFIQHKSEINCFGLDSSDLSTMLFHILSNYTISHGDHTFLQTKGVAMGCHSGPAFAIIYMGHIESIALRTLPSHCQPQLFKRYIDDIFMGPFPFDSVLHSSILDHFNSIDPSIQFTLESKTPSDWLPFLDIKFRNSDGFLEYAPFSKPFHSDICLHFSSHHPSHVKSNFVRNHFLTIKRHSSSPTLATEASSIFTSKLLANGYPLSFIRSCQLSKSKKHTTPTQGLATLKLPFIHPAVSRKLRKAISSSGLPVRLVELSGPSLTQLCSKSSSSGRCTPNCSSCSFLPSYQSCQTNFVVYKLSCCLCSSFYIGQTYRKFSCRLKEHLACLKDRSSSSAMTQHFIDHHPTSKPDPPFSAVFLARASSRSDLLIKESLLISSHYPSINRTFESSFL